MVVGIGVANVGCFFSEERKSNSDLSLFGFDAKVPVVSSFRRVPRLLIGVLIVHRAPKKGSERIYGDRTRVLFVQLNYLGFAYGTRNKEIPSRNPEEKTPENRRDIHVSVLPAFLLSSIEETSSRRSCSYIGGRTGGDLNWKVPRCVTCHRERC